MDYVFWAAGRYYGFPVHLLLVVAAGFVLILKDSVSEKSLSIGVGEQKNFDIGEKVGKDLVRRSVASPVLKDISAAQKMFPRFAVVNRCMCI